MTKKNLECGLKYCSNCKVRLQQRNCREEDDHIVLTRHCPKCGKNVHLVEVSKEDYNGSVQAINKIIDFLAELKGGSQ